MAVSAKMADILAILVISYLNSIDQLIFVIEMRCVFFEVGTGFLYIT
jgi:hypothetical protein